MTQVRFLIEEMQPFIFDPFVKVKFFCKFIVNVLRKGICQEFGPKL